MSDSQVFAGFRGVLEFWGLLGEDAMGDEEFGLAELAACPEEWREAPLMFLNADECWEAAGQLLEFHDGEHLVVREVQVGAVSVQALQLSADGGFQTFLFRAADLEALSCALPGLVWVEREG